MKSCSHLETLEDTYLTDPEPFYKQGCEECGKAGGRWVHLRQCLICGHVGCCDDSPGKHATKHFHATKHPLMRSLEPGETWGWCFADEVMIDFEN